VADQKPAIATPVLREFHASAERFRLLVESVQDYAIFLLDRQGHVVSWNAGAQRIKGYDAREIIGQHFSVFFTPEDRALGRPETELEAAVAAGRSELESWRVRKDGTRFWANIVITALRDEHGLQGFAKVTRDLTERRRKEAAERLAAAHLEANRLKDQFLATLSHELRTPLNVVMGQLRRLRSGRLTAEQAGRAWEALERNTRLQLRIVEDLLDTSHILSGHLRISRGPVALDRVAGAVLDETRPFADAQSVTLSAELAPVVVPGDSARLQQVVSNLVNNAVKYTPSGGRVSVTLQRSKDGATLRVRDTGIGIDPDFLPRIFERFTQGDPSDTRMHGGLGLGLAITRDLVTMHGGTIEAASEGRSRGSTFTVHLPFTVPDADQP
jgi:PAS domain S-box-containing protein